MSYDRQVGESAEAHAARLRSILDDQDREIHGLRERLTRRSSGGEPPAAEEEAKAAAGGLKGGGNGVAAPGEQRAGGRHVKGLLLKSLLCLAATLLLLVMLPPLLYWLDRSILYPGYGVSIPASLQGHTVLVTGSSQGIGLFSALEFCKKGAHVIVTGRKKAKTEAAARQVRAGNPGKATAMTLDLSSFDDVRRFARESGKNFPKLDVLILNAGIGYAPLGGFPKNTTAPSGHDLAYATNYLGHFLLVKLLQPRLTHGAPIVLVGSAAMWSGLYSELTPKTRPRYDLPVKQGGKPRGKAYANSKLAEVCWAKALRRKLGSRHPVFPMAPGFVDTAINGRVSGQESPCRRRLLKWWCGTPEVSGRIVLETAYVTRRPEPDFLYPYAFPKAIYGPYAPQSAAAKRHANSVIFGYPSMLERLTFGTLHESVGPGCEVKTQAELWKWSAEAVGVPP